MIDDGTITRLGENDYRWTAADPSLRWFQQNALGLDVTIDDISEQTAALALQGPTSGKLLHAVADANITNLKYFRVTHGKIAGVPVDISRTGYTGDLGFEVWMPWKDAVKVWDALIAKGKAFDIHPAGMIALDIARIEAGLILIEVDYISSKKALIESQRYSPAEIGLGKLVDLKKETFVGREALAQEAKKGADRALVGLEINWNEVEALYDKLKMAPHDSAEGMMQENADGSGQFVRVTLKPAIKVAKGNDLSKARALHEQAHHLCFIARSVNFPVEVSPQVEEQPNESLIRHQGLLRNTAATCKADSPVLEP